MERQGIRLQGETAEKFFRRLVPSAQPPHSESRGDARVTVDGHEYHVEIKECHASPGASGTINQIRPIKYITLVVYAPRRKCWYMVPPNNLVYLAAQKCRGQHTEIPFECMNLTIRQLDDQGFKCIDADLPNRVHEAVRKGKQDTQTRKIMGDLFSAIKALDQEYKQKILRINR